MHWRKCGQRLEFDNNEAFYNEIKFELSHCLTTKKHSNEIFLLMCRAFTLQCDRHRSLINLF